jgi:hypothetical protein
MRRYIRKLEGEKKVLEELLTNSNLESLSVLESRESERQSLSSSRLQSDTSNIIIDSD